MKKYILGLTLISITVFSCKKDNKKNTGPTTDKTLHNIAFNVGFSQQTGSFKTNDLTTNGLAANAVDTALTNHISVLMYLIYDSSGKAINTNTQLSIDNGFGTETIKLANGTYTVVIVGGATGMTFTGVSSGSIVTLTGQPATQLTSSYICYAASSQPQFLVAKPFIYDTFLKTITLTVNNADQTQGISLDRIVSKVVINISDAIPANTAAINTSFEGIGLAYNIATGDVLTAANIENNGYTFGDIYQDINLSPSDIGTKNYQISALLLSQAPMTIDLYASSVANSPGTPGTGTSAPIKQGITNEKVITNVTCMPGAMTILTGNLFGGAGSPAGNGFTTNIDTTWSTTPILKPFNKQR